MLMAPSNQGSFFILLHKKNETKSKDYFHFQKSLCIFLQKWKYENNHKVAIRVLLIYADFMHTGVGKQPIFEVSAVAMLLQKAGFGTPEYCEMKWGGMGGKAA